MVPGRCLLGVCKQVAAELGDKASFLPDLHSLVVESLKAQGAAAAEVSSNSCQQKLQDQLPQLKALATGSGDEPHVKSEQQ